VVNTLGRIEAQGRVLPPDALEQATRTIEQEPEIQRLDHGRVAKQRFQVADGVMLDLQRYRFASMSSVITL
jgi:hypothetical protein